MKKILLKKKATTEEVKRIGYKINYASELNTAQYQAVMHDSGPALVIAGAGTGKTRTLIYRVARLIEDGVPPESILLLTFTRKSATEMLRRASLLLDGRCEKVSGGTFHSFALGILRKHSELIGYSNNFSVIDQSDATDTINLLRNNIDLKKYKKRFPRKETLQTIFSLSVNTNREIEEILSADYPNYLDFSDIISRLFRGFAEFKRTYNTMDYDDLLTNLLVLCRTKPDIRKELNQKYKYVLVDEYQDTNKLQHDIVWELAGRYRNVMAVGDDAQSIYSFRGAEYDNIMEFPDKYEGCEIFKIEENYRSTQPILNLANALIAAAPIKYEKELFTRRTDEELPAIVKAKDERQQSEFIAQQILELHEEGLQFDEMAVLFRSGFLSFDLEIELSRANIPYRKFGGMKFVETAHVKDLLAFFKILHNPQDAINWNRILLLLDGIGPRTAQKVIDLMADGRLSLDDYKILNTVVKSRDNLTALFAFVSGLRHGKAGIGDKAAEMAQYYKPIIKKKYDDWKKRWKDIEMFISIADRYNSLAVFLNDMAMEPPVESVVDIEEEIAEDAYLTLSTIHSAKGLEWKAVFLIWALDGRFPSAKAIDESGMLEEERRLFYVACTRARDYLYISYPTKIFDRTSGIILSKPSRFLDGIGEDIAGQFVLQEWEQGEN